MADKEAEKIALPPGRYESPYKRWPGYIQFPDPLELPHFEEYWNTAVKPLKNMTVLDWDRFNFEWIGGRHLLLEYGEWHIEGIPIGEVRNGRIPLELVSWVSDCASGYVFPKLSARQRGALRGM